MGKLRHIETNQLWVQEKVRETKIEIVKIKGTGNIADPFTKHVDSKLIDKNMYDADCRILVGIHEIMFGVDEHVECIINKDSENIDAGNICMLTFESSDNKNHVAMHTVQSSSSASRASCEFAV